MQRHQQRGLAISALGLLLMLAGGFAAADFRQRIAPSRFLVQPMNVAVSADEQHIVVGSMFEKLVVLGPDGRQLRAWRMPTDGGAFRIELGEDDRLRVATAATGRLLEYTLDGELLAERDDPEAYARMGAAHERGYTAASGVQYLIEEGRIVRAEDGAEQVLVRGFASHAAITLRLVAMGLALFVGVTLLIGGFISTGRRRRAA